MEKCSDQVLILLVVIVVVVVNLDGESLSPSS